MRNKKGYRKFE